MRSGRTTPADFEALRPRLKVLLDLYAAAGRDARSRLEREFEELFLATAWHIARDLIDNGYQPVVVASPPSRARGCLKLVDDVDAA